MAIISWSVFGAIAILIVTCTFASAQYEALTELPPPPPPPQTPSPKQSSSQSSEVPTSNNGTVFEYPRVVMYSVPNVSTIMITWIATMTMIFSMCGARRQFLILRDMKETLAKHQTI